MFVTFNSFFVHINDNSTEILTNTSYNYDIVLSDNTNLSTVKKCKITYAANINVHNLSGGSIRNIFSKQITISFLSDTISYVLAFLNKHAL